MANREFRSAVNDVYIPYFEDRHRYNVVYGSAGCFVAGTPVRVLNGYKAIEDVVVGDCVLTLSEKIGLLEFKKVVNKFRYSTFVLNQDLITFVFDDKEITCTHEHKFYFEGNWVMAWQLAERIMEKRFDWQRNILHKQYGPVTYNEPLWVREVGCNEAGEGCKRLSEDNDCRGRREIAYGEDPSDCCKGMAGKPIEPAGSESPKRCEVGQPCGKPRMGNTQAEHNSFFPERITDYSGIEKPVQQTHRRTGQGNTHTQGEGVGKEKDGTGTKVWRGFRYNKAYFVPQGQVLEARTIDIDKIKSISVSNIDTYVYDLEVEDNHNFCITEDSIIVHNSGKSRATAQKLIYRCITEIGTTEEPFHHRFAVIRKYKTSIKQSVFEEIKGELVRMGIGEIVQINESYMTFRFWNGAEIFCIGLDDPEKIKSIVASGAWIEEATELEENDFSMLDLRFRGESPYPKQIIITFNPIDETHWIKKVFFDRDQKDMTYILHTTYRDNYFIDEQYKKVLEEKYAFDENLKRIYVYGEWGRIKRGSEFFFNFKYDRHIVKDMVLFKDEPLHLSFDFNVNPHITCLVAQIIKRDVRMDDGKIKMYFFVNVYDEITLPNPHNTTERLCDEIVRRYNRHLPVGCFIYGDASGKMTSTRSNINDYDIIQEILRSYISNYSMRVPKANPQIKIRRNFINKVFYGSYNIEIRINEKCKALITDLQSVLESEEGGVTKQMGRNYTSGIVYEKYGHASDCFSYLLCEAFRNYYDSIF